MNTLSLFDPPRAAPIPSPGEVVGAKRWPYDAAHPDCWQTPWKGVVLAQDDPRVWARSTAFPVDKPDPDAVKLHVVWCRSQGWLSDWPVLWDFGTEQKVYWSDPRTLRPYAEDYLDWIRTRDTVRAKIAACNTNPCHA